MHTPHASAVCEAPADCVTAGVFPTRKPRTQQPARAQLSFPAQASKLRALPKLLLLPPLSSARRLRSSSFFTRNEKRHDRNARAASNLFAEADSAPRLAADVRLRRLLYLASRMEHERKERDGERENDEAVKAGRAQRGLLRCVRGKKERRGGGKREKSFAPRGKHRSRRGASEASSLT
jgi:hypothetical protein